MIYKVEKPFKFKLKQEMNTREPIEFSKMLMLVLNTLRTVKKHFLNAMNHQTHVKTKGDYV